MKKRINITLEESIIEKVDILAKVRGIDRSTMISILIYDSYDLLELRMQGEDISNRFIDDFGGVH